MSQTIALKLVSGEEILAHSDVIWSNGQMFNHLLITVTKARVLHLTGDGNRVGLALAPFMFSNIDGEIVIKTDNILSVSNQIPKQIEDTYLEQTSGLALASSM